MPSRSRLLPGSVRLQSQWKRKMIARDFEVIEAASLLEPSVSRERELQ
jgi:hypothetical protein